MEQIKLSKRLHTVAHLIEQNNIVADIGTDHGYLPIYIVKNNISKQVIAMDVRKGPLEKAKKNVEAYQVTEAVDIRLSDGLANLKPLEAETITICGMGGKLIQSILTKGNDKFDRNTQLIVSPQSELSEFRKFLIMNGYSIKQELMLKEEDQFYLIIDCRCDHIMTEQDRRNVQKTLDYDVEKCDAESVRTQTFLRFGQSLLEKKDETLFEYLKHEQSVNDKVFGKLNTIEHKDSAVIKRLQDLSFDRKCVDEALKYYNI